MVHGWALTLAQNSVGESVLKWEHSMGPKWGREKDEKLVGLMVRFDIFYKRNHNYVSLCIPDRKNPCKIR